MTLHSQNSAIKAAKIPHDLSIHGHHRIDNYFWMKERDSKEVLDYLGQENKSAEAYFAPLQGFVTTLMTDIKQLFYSNYTINEPISSWDTANVTDMSEMFVYATAFNQPIGSWNTDKVTNMSYMFYNAHAFNQPIGSWNTANVTNMGSMFEYAYAFNQNISNWNVALVTIYTIFRQNSALSDENTPPKFR